jgi:uncharacterized repeat protein (TIGR03803 family)
MFWTKLMKSLSVTTMTAFLALTSTKPAQAQTFSVLYNLGTNTGDPENPYDPGVIAQGRDGNLYSSTVSGGQFGTGCCEGTVYGITPDGVLTVLYNFTNDNGDGNGSFSGVTLGTDGRLYGGAGGGTFANGLLFRIPTTGGTLTHLHDFTGGSDGRLIFSPPIQGSDGNFYGTTYQGGNTSLCGGIGCGTVYKLTPSGTFTTLYQFDMTHGEAPYVPLVQGTDGNFYGTTYYGGTSNLGVVFKITSAGKLTVLHNFDGIHGQYSLGSLIQAADGNFYGTTFEGGSASPGTIFRITPTGKFSVLHNMDNSKGEGYGPAAGLVQATDGNFYGANSAGGINFNGTIFKITPKGVLSVLYSFDSTTGATPLVSLVQHTNGVLYGNTLAGGAATQGDCNGATGCGVFYSLNIGAAPFVSLVSTTAIVGKTVEILGQAFTGTTSVSFGGATASYRAASDTYLTATVPSGATTGAVTVTTPGGTLTSNKTFRVTPQLKSFTPPSGPVGTVVTITGVSLIQTTKVTFGGVAATSFAVNSDTQVTATVPTGAVTGKILITTAGGTASSSAIFTVTP